MRRPDSILDWNSMSLAFTCFEECKASTAFGHALICFSAATYNVLARTLAFKFGSFAYLFKLRINLYGLMHSRSDEAVSFEHTSKLARAYLKERVSFMFRLIVI